MSSARTAEQILTANTRYHDVAADDYDAKWGIDFGQPGRRQVLTKLRKALGSDRGRTFQRSLEIGSGTGYFSLNLLQAGVVQEAVCTDISPGMLDRLQRNARRLALDVETVVARAEQLPFAEGEFDLVLGHAVLHHLPHLERAFAEFHRVLCPGGTFAFAGEPSRHGDRIAQLPKRGAVALAPTWRTLMRAGPAAWIGNGNGNGGGGPDADPDAEDHALEHIVDVHAFAPRELTALARDAGFEQVRVRGEELLASWFGWANRTLESSADPRDVPWLWRQYAYRGYLALQVLDRRLLESRLPPAIFYNLLVSGRRPA